MDARDYRIHKLAELVDSLIVRIEEIESDISKITGKEYNIETFEDDIEDM